MWASPPTYRLPRRVRFLCGAMHPKGTCFAAWASPPTYRLPKAYAYPTGRGRAVRPYTRSDVPCERPLPLPLGEVAERSEDGEGKQRRAASRRPFFQLVDKPSLCGQRFLYAGGARGGKARLESDQMSRKALPCKACVEHPKGTCFAARSDYFRAARRHKNNDIISGCRKKPEAFSTV